MVYTYEAIIKDVHPKWIKFFEKNKEELKSILNKINQDEEIYPLEYDVLNTFKYFGPKNIKLVILGQDPYPGLTHGRPNAHGLSFSVPESNKIPMSLKNIFKEIKSCYPDYIIPNHGNLLRWVKEENILLLNSALTLKAGVSNSHQQYWTEFTDKIISYISKKNKGTIFLLMGNFAIKKSNLIDHNKHKIFKTVHPSPLSANNGFFGCQVFKLINQHLIDNNLEPILW